VDGIEAGSARKKESETPDIAKEAMRKAIEAGNCVRDMAGGLCE